MRSPEAIQRSDQHLFTGLLIRRFGVRIPGGPRSKPAGRRPIVGRCHDPIAAHTHPQHTFTGSHVGRDSPEPCYRK
jgi:hypothetical protein